MSSPQEQFSQKFNSYFETDQKKTYENVDNLKKFADRCVSLARKFKDDEPVVSSEFYFLGAFSCLFYLFDVDINNSYAISKGYDCISDACNILNDDEYKTVLACFQILKLDSEQIEQNLEELKDIDKMCPTIRLIENNLLNIQYLEDQYNLLLFTVLSSVTKSLRAAKLHGALEEACLWLQKSPYVKHKMLAYASLAERYVRFDSFEEAERCAKLGINLLGPNHEYNSSEEISEWWAICWTTVAECRYYAKDFDFAESLLEKGVKLGITTCMIRLGNMYKYGEGVDKDEKKARQLYNQAMNLGNGAARFYLDRYNQIESWFTERKIAERDFKIGHYKGQIFNDIMYGHGKLKYDKKAFYEGSFISGSRTGQGTMLYSDDVKYTGTWLGDNRNGLGKLTWPDGSYYEGSWRDDKIHGEGQFRYSDGSYYEGSFRLGRRHGRGTMIYTNGDKYVGDWLNDNRTGFGTYYWPKAGRHEGYWLNNNRQGYGIAYAQDGSIIREGQWDNDKEV